MFYTNMTGITGQFQSNLNRMYKITGCG